MCAAGPGRLYNLDFSFWAWKSGETQYNFSLSPHCMRVADLIIKYINSTQIDTLVLLVEAKEEITLL